MTTATESNRAIMQSHHERTSALIDDLRAALRLIERKQAYYTQWLDSGVRPGDFVVSLPAATTENWSQNVRRKAVRDARKFPPGVV